MSDTLPTRSRRRRLLVEQLEDRVTPAGTLITPPGFTPLPTVSVVAPGYIPGRVLVEVSAPSAIAAIHQSPLTTNVLSLGGGGAYRVDLAPGVPVEGALVSFASIPGVTVTEADYPISLNLTPNDPQYNSGKLWGLNNFGQFSGTLDADIDAPEGWDIATGTGKTIVSVIDTGVDYTHSDLYLNIWINNGEIPTAIRNVLVDTDGDGVITFRDLNQAVNQGAGKIQDWNNNGRIDGGDVLDNKSGWEFDGDNDNNGYVDDIIGWDFADYDNDPMDFDDHGTHVSGTIGAIGNNGAGVTGVAWRTRIGPLKFFGASQGGSVSAAVAAINYSRVNGMKVSNNSWGGGAPSTLEFNAINNFRIAGGIFVASAGNNSLNNDLVPHYPSNYNVDNVISVAAMDRNDNLSSFSHFGVATVDIGAPGTDITSTVIGGSFGTISGTSMASPHVAGVAAVVWDLNPQLTYAQVIARILQTARPVGSMAGKVATGGMLNLEAALSVVNPPPPPSDTAGARVLAAAFSGATSSSFNMVRITFNENILGGSFTLEDVISLTGPGGVPITPTGVTMFFSNQYDVTFPDQTAGGTYTIVVGPEILDLSSNPMNQDNDLINGEVPADRFTGIATIAGGYSHFSTSIRAPISDFATTIVPITVPITQTIADINVTFDISHTWDSDLQIFLRSPNGTQITLVNRRGGAGDNFSGTTLDDEATGSIVNGVAPFAGTFRPEGLLSTFDNLAANGTWQFRVYDASRGDVGRVGTVTLSIQFNASGQSLKFTAPTNGGPPVVELVSPPVRVGGDFGKLGVTTAWPPLMTPTPGKRFDATAGEPLTIIGNEEPPVAIISTKPLWITEVYDDSAEDFLSVEV